ncbi:MAG: S46 family peptidase [Gemmatimonadota bacterium]|nr:S46 family peptidase [Gemmatimonadota bacterium]MDH3421471.1 S46 family peptidase [Gemmatimonadota bacterium]
MHRSVASGRVSLPTALGGLLFLAACGGSPPAPAGPAPVPTPAPAPTTAAPVPIPEPAPPAAPRPFVYGVDLDTVRAGPFDQGKMWTFDAAPAAYFTDTYGFTADEAWFERARLGALRIPNCSASFVSPNGLVMTNHHCSREFLTQVTRGGEALLDDGFVAQNLADERPVEDFDADQLIEIVDVTDEVNAALDALPADQRGEARAALLEEIETRLLGERGGEDSGFVVEMVSLYNGGRTSAYVFRRYTNAKLVVAPELQMGYFGGDPDNFTYPRYALDFAFFRIYGDDGQPLSDNAYFPVDADGLREGEAIFIVGNPGSTSRLQSLAELEYRRDIGDRVVTEFYRSRMEALGNYIEAFPAEAEELDLRNSWFSLSNSLKAFRGRLGGLEDPIILARRADTDRRFQAAIDARPDLAPRYGALLGRMAELQELKRELAAPSSTFVGFGSPDLGSTTLFRAFFAFQVMNARQGGAPPEALEGLIEQIRSVPDRPQELDQLLVEARLRDLVAAYGPDSETARAALGGMSVEERARTVVTQSQLQDSASAVAAVEGGTLSMADPAMGIMRGLIPAYIEYQDIFPIFEEEEAIAADLGRARFEVYGTDVPPDATFSLRIADGVVAGYDYNGTTAPPFTTIYGLYDRHYSHDGKQDWALPDRWLNPPATLDLATPMNFIATSDIIGGNSGSPALDQDLEVVGLVFDGNIESLPGDYIYLPELNRSVMVDIRAIIEALDEIYDLDRLVLELTTGRLTTTEQEADQARR